MESVSRRIAATRRIDIATITSNLIDRGNDLIVIVFQKCDGGL